MSLGSSGNSAVVGGLTFVTVWSSWTLLDKALDLLPEVVAFCVAGLTAVLSLKALLLHAVALGDCETSSGHDAEVCNPDRSSS